MKPCRVAVLVGAVLCVVGIGCERPRPAVDFTPEEIEAILELSPLPDPPPSPTNRYADSAEAARFGERLFLEKRLSRNGEISCATCHDPDQDFADGQEIAQGIRETRRHAPALWNGAYQRWFYWDGRSDSLWAQSLNPLEHPDEMGMTRVGISRLIAHDEELAAEYRGIFGALPDLDWDALPDEARPMKMDKHPHHTSWVAMDEADRASIDRMFSNLGKAIAAFERTLISRNSPFDRFVAGLRNGDAEGLAAISESAQRGLRLFVGRGQCTLCHTGPTFSDREFHNIGLSRGPRGILDLGRFGGVAIVKSDPFNGLGEFSDDRSPETNKKIRFVAAKENNVGEFKTPTLRNVARTAPYMHDGRFETLEEVVRFYSLLDEEPALGHREESLKELNLTSGEVRDLVRFLESLTGASLLLQR